MAAYKVTPAEVMGAIQDKNLEAAPGKLGERSNEVFEYVIKYKGKLTKPEEYENIAIRANADGSVLHLKDVARVELGAYSYTSVTHLNGKDGIAIGVIQLAGSNANEIQIAVDKLMEKASKDFPAGIANTTTFIAPKPRWTNLSAK
jgi:HAE1 family hydrophobic/amphiphilic exporter-1